MGKTVKRVNQTKNWMIWGGGVRFSIQASWEMNYDDANDQKYDPSIKMRRQLISFFLPFLAFTVLWKMMTSFQMDKV